MRHANKIRFVFLVAIVVAFVVEAIVSNVLLVFKINGVIVAVVACHATHMLCCSFFTSIFVIVPPHLFLQAKLNDPDDVDVKNLSRSSTPSELLFGPLQLCCVMCWLSLYHFMTQEAAILAAEVGIGDGLAPLIGTQYGRHTYCMPLSNRKTMEGSVVGVFLGTVAACYVFMTAMGLEIPPLRCVLVYGILAAMVEGSSPGNFDNVSVAIVMHLSMDEIKKWIPP